MGGLDAIRELRAREVTQQIKTRYVRSSLAPSLELGSQRYQNQGVIAVTGK